MIAAPEAAAVQGARSGAHRVAAALGGAVRVVLGVLWMLEGIVKLRAGFGASDIGFVVSGASTNSRVPEPFAWFATNVMGGAPELFGFAVPLVELGLGLALVLGVLAAPAAWTSIALLLTYWMSDQLTDVYPVMVALSAIVVAFPLAATRWGLTGVLTAWRSRRSPESPALPTALRRWL